MPSNQERTEENLEGMQLALTRSGGGFERYTAGEAIGAIERQRRQNGDGNDNRRDVLDTRLSRKSWAHSQISFIESGFRQVHSRYRAATDCGPQQKQTQHPSESLHANLTQS